MTGPPRRGHAVYYGPPSAGALAALARCALVVVQPGLYLPAQLAALRAGGTRVLGYLSVGEDHALGDVACVPGTRPYHLTPDPAWNSVRVDAAHPEWRATLLERAAQALEHTDGLLLDTLDSAAPGAVLARCREIRATWPGAALLANRGFGLWPHLSVLVDGVLFEAFSTGHSPCAPHDPEGLAYTRHWAAELRAAGRPTHALDYADTPELAAFARARAAGEGLETFVTRRALDWPAGWPGAQEQGRPAASRGAA